jgi:phosphatidylinositol alpha-mannosyltransferase
VLVPRGDAVTLAETLRDLALDPARRAAMAREAAVHARRFDWGQVSQEISSVYEEAIAARRRVVPVTGRQRAAARLALVAADGKPKVLPQRLPSMEPQPAGAGRARTRALARRAGLGIAALTGLLLTALALQRIGVDKVAASLLNSSPSWVIAAVGVMCASMVLRAISWHAILNAALPESHLTRFDALQGTSIGVLMSATLPARLGEPSRALIVARRAGRPRETLPPVVGTLVSQTLLNLLALAILAAIAFSSVHIFDQHHGALVAIAIAPLVLLLAIVVVPVILRAGGTERFGRLHAVVRPVRAAAFQVRQGLRVFGRPRDGAIATAAQLGAWALQAASCYMLLVAIGLHGAVGVGAAAAVLLAVNVTAVLPATPSNVGVFQAACVAVLTGAYGISTADALGYGIVLQAVEIATAVIMGVPALLKEGLSWRDVRLRAMHSSPVRLNPLPPRQAVPAEGQLVIGDV